MSISFRPKLRYDWPTGRADLIAGITVAAVALPEGIAYALIAGVDPKYGVYSAIVVTAIASIFGSSSQLINGPTSAISLLVFSSLAFIDQDNRNVLFESLFALGVLVGIIQILIAVLRLGDLTRYISESVILGFIAAAALQLLLGQIPDALGIKNKGNGKMNILHRLYLTLFHGDRIAYRAVILSVTAVVAAILLRRLVKRFGLPHIDLLLVLIVGGIIAYSFGWSTPNSHGKTAVELSANIPASLPGFHIPTITPGTVGHLTSGAFAIAFIGLLEAISIAKSIAHQTQQKVDYNRQILAEGLSNLVGGFFQSVPGSGSLTRSAINYQAGARSRFSGIVAAVVVGIALLLFGPLLRYVPEASLAGLLLVIAVRLIDVRRLWATLRTSRVDAAVLVVTFVTGVWINLDKAVLLGVALSIVLFVPRAAKLQASELTVSDEGVVRGRTAADPEDRDIAIYDLEGELFFGALPELDRYLDALHERIHTDGAQVVVLRLKRVRHPDAVTIDRIADFLREETDAGATILLAGVRPDTLTILHNIGLTKWFPAEQIFPEQQRGHSATLAAVRYARELIAIAKADGPGGSTEAAEAALDKEESTPLYYLV
ncbi:SulP family inorganic anion transporter [Tsukamurella soli]|uniref:SulP family inorganic anion transporter n=1 Tax=Tsukamurella soli TaxID=644556 RepID=A0ABP8JEI3_9ACTN